MTAPSTFIALNRARPASRTAVRVVQAAVLLGLLLIGIGPLYWMVKGAISNPTELTTEPLALWPDEPLFGNFSSAYTDLGVGRSLLNTVLIVGGCWFVQVFVSTTAGFALSVLRPRFGNVVYGAILATMFVPYSVNMVSLFLTVTDVPLIHLNLGDTYWAIWLPAGTNAFTVLLAKQFFDALPKELFDAARVDGASTRQLLTKIVLPMSRPVLAVISLLAVMHAWKDFIWPLVALTDPAKQPISVTLAQLATQAPQDQLIAAMVMAVIPPVLVFVVCQKYIVSGLGFTGVKG
ncbi:carbohydrate ABC transporter permease [Streptomyces sp. NPDC051940]|uniref:carbohydrate ABC transporter permease n=1 Tax=Streptomyces sp. NPDC051940 TaxID=3155675 RepID=UPI0034404477